MGHLEHLIATGPDERGSHANDVLARQHGRGRRARCIGQQDFTHANHLLGPFRVVGRIGPPNLGRSMSVGDGRNGTGCV